MWLREDGTVCPFGVFSLCFVAILVQFEADPCEEASCCLAASSPWFYRHFTFQARRWPFQAPNTLR